MMCVCVFVLGFFTIGFNLKCISHQSWGVATWMLGESRNYSPVPVCINVEPLSTSFGFAESPSNRLEYSHVGFSVLLPCRPIDSECR